MNVILLLSLMNIILLIQAQRSETEVDLFNLLDGGKTGYVNTLDVDRVNNFKKNTIGSKKDVGKLKEAILQFENKRVSKSQFNGILQSLNGLNATVDLKVYLGKKKTILDYLQVKELLGIQNEEMDSRIFCGDNVTGNGAYINPKVLARLINA